MGGRGRWSVARPAYRWFRHCGWREQVGEGIASGIGVGGVFWRACRPKPALERKHERGTVLVTFANKLVDGETAVARDPRDEPVRRRGRRRRSDERRLRRRYDETATRARRPGGGARGEKEAGRRDACGRPAGWRRSPWVARYAFLRAVPAPIVNVFDPAKVDVHIDASATDGVKSDVALANTGDVDAWMRAHVRRFLGLDEGGNVVGLGSPWRTSTTRSNSRRARTGFSAKTACTTGRCR